ncbi:MAG: cation:proton antiporter [Planctomycetes bacterium]|nr:cation:proton antiporter [Planctomycetota bacterium]
MSESNFYFLLFLILISGKVLAELAERLGLPAVLGELCAGIMLGPSLFNCIPYHENETGFYMIRDVARLGICVLLFRIGLETSFAKMAKVGLISIVTATVGVICPFMLSFVFCQLFGLTLSTTLFIGTTLTATSVGLTARVFSDLKRLDTKESQIILGAAIIDDVIGLIVLSVVSGISVSGSISFIAIEKTILFITGFFIFSFLLSGFVKPLFNLLDKAKTRGVVITISFCFLLIMAYYANYIGMATISGAFLAGMLLTRTKQLELIDEKTKPLVEILTPIFFVVVGASVNLRILNPFNPENRDTLVLCAFLIPIAIVGKFVSGFSVWKKGINKAMVGVGMIPRGEVALVCAQVGLSSSVLTQKTFSALVVTIIATALVAPPIIKFTIKKTIL